MGAADLEIVGPEARRRQPCLSVVRQPLVSLLAGAQPLGARRQRGVQRRGDGPFLAYLSIWFFYEFLVNFATWKYVLSQCGSGSVCDHYKDDSNAKLE